MEEEITILQEELDLEKLQIKYGIEVVVDNVKQYEGNNHYGGKIKLETHCTIIRVKNSPESVHFGHVTLVYYYDEHDDNKTIRWHYGTKVNTEILPLRKDLTSDFWYNDNTHDPSTTKVGTFGTFNRIKKDVKLEEIMLYNFDQCVEFFNTKKSQWPKQVWNDGDMIGSEKATDVLERLIRVNKLRESINYNSYMSKLKEKRDIIKKEIKRERKVNKQARKQQEQEEQEEQEHASLLVNTPEEIEALNIQRELAKKEFEELMIQRELKDREKEAIERQQEIERLANAKKQNGEELVPDKEKEAKETKKEKQRRREREQKEARKKKEIEAIEARKQKER